MPERQTSFYAGTEEFPRLELPELATDDPLLHHLESILAARKQWQERPERGGSLALIADLRNPENPETVIDTKAGWQKTADEKAKQRVNSLSALIIVTTAINQHQIKQIEIVIQSMERALKYKGPVVILEERANELELAAPLDPETIRKHLQKLRVAAVKTLTSSRIIRSLAPNYRLTIARAPSPRRKWPKEAKPAVQSTITEQLHREFTTLTEPVLATTEHSIDLYPPTRNIGSVYKDRQGNIFMVASVQTRAGETAQVMGIRRLKPEERSAY